MERSVDLSKGSIRMIASGDYALNNKQHNWSFIRLNYQFDRYSLLAYQLTEHS